MPDTSTLPLDSYRPYLTLLARTHLANRYQRRIDASDIVQQTLLEAHDKRDQYRGESENELAGWLRQMLVHNVADAVRAMRRAKRDIRREQALEAAVEDSFCRVHDWLASEQSSASKQLMRDEQLLTLSSAVTSLSDDQREAIILHYLQGYTLKQLAEQLERSESAVAGLLHRGIAKSPQGDCRYGRWRMNASSDFRSESGRIHASDNVPENAPEFNDALAEYFHILESGKELNRTEWLSRYPQWADGLREFLASHDEMESFAGEMRRRRNSVLAVSPFGTEIKYVGEYELLEQLGQGGISFFMGGGDDTIRFFDNGVIPAIAFQDVLLHGGAGEDEVIDLDDLFLIGELEAISIEHQG